MSSDAATTVRRASNGSQSSTGTTPPGRKYGLHHLLNQAMSSATAAAPMAPPPDPAAFRSAVETFLDDNGDFLEDYIQRKVHRSQMEQWLFRSKRNRAGSEQFTSSSGNIPHYGSTSPLRSEYLQQQQHQQRSLASSSRQRSRSFTPLRKLSATKFEESGLATPILNRDVDGQLSFLRTQRDFDHFNGGSPVGIRRAGEGSPHETSDGSVGSGASQHCLFALVEDIVRETQSSGVARSLCHGLKKAVHCPVDSVKVLLTRKQSSFNGDMYCLNRYDSFSKDTAGTADHLMTATMTSKQIHLTERPDMPFDENDTTSNGNQRVRSALTAPLIDLETGRAFGSVQMLSTGGVFTGEDERILQTTSRLSAMVFMRAKEKRRMSLELARSEVFLELARTVFAEQSRIEPTVKTILANFLTMIECERCQILLTNSDADAYHEGGKETPSENTNVFKKVFDLQRSELDENGSADAVKFDGGAPTKFPVNVAVTGDVARTGEKVNITSAQNDPRFEPAKSSGGGGGDVSPLQSMLCMPIRDCTSEKILGVISLVNKENGGKFTENDERFVEAFSIFCGMAIRNASDFEAAVLSEAKLQVAFETLNVQAASSEDEARALVKVSVPSAAALNLDSFKFNYLDLEDVDIYKSVIRMFTDFGLLSRFDINYGTFCRWLLTVKKNYRNETVKYHNWYHAFNVCQTMYCMLKNTGWNEKMGEVQCLGLLIACLGHDLDHRGTTNSFQIKAKNSLATLYSSSTMERHHLNQCLLLLNIPGNRILENMNETEYTEAISVIERSILATDLAHHFRSASKIRSLANRQHHADLPSDLVSADTEDRRLLQCALMTGADLAAVTKPWELHSHVTQLIAEEFWAQGDLEREEFHEAPAPMMDRQFSLALVQIDFIDKVAKDVYRDLSTMHPAMRPMHIGCLENKARWERVERGETPAESESDGEDPRPRSREEAARNL